MVAPFSVTIIGAEQVKRRLGAVSNGLAHGNMINNALRAAALIPMNAAKQKAPWLTGNLRRSLHVGGFGDGLESPTTGTDIGQPSGRHVVSVGTNVAYAARQEFGFAGTDSRGRTYHQPARPYLRPALDENKAEMEREFADALEDLLRASLR